MSVKLDKFPHLTNTPDCIRASDFIQCQDMSAETNVEFSLKFKHNPDLLYVMINLILRKNAEYKPSLTENVLPAYKFGDVTDEIINAIKEITK